MTQIFLHVPSSVGVRKVWVPYRRERKLDVRPSVQFASLSTDEDGFVTFDWEMWATRSGSRKEVARLSTAICGGIAEYKWTPCALQARSTVLQGGWREAQSFWRGKTLYRHIWGSQLSITLSRTLNLSLCKFFFSLLLHFQTRSVLVSASVLTSTMSVSLPIYPLQKQLPDHSYNR